MLHNVTGMLDRMYPAEMDALEAYDNVHGIGLSRLREIITNGLAHLIMSWGDSDKMDFEDVKKAIDPWLQRD